MRTSFSRRSTPSSEKYVAPTPFAVAIGHGEFHGLRGFCAAGASLKCHAAGFHVDQVGLDRRLLPCARAASAALCSSICTSPLHWMAPSGFRVAAAVRVDHVVAIAQFAEHGHLHFFQQADVLALQVRGLRGLHSKYGAIPFVLGEGQARSIAAPCRRPAEAEPFLLDMRHPLAAQVDSAGDDQPAQGGPARTNAHSAPLRFASCFQLIRIREGCTHAAAGRSRSGNAASDDSLGA